MRAPDANGCGAPSVGPEGSARLAFAFSGAEPEAPDPGAPSPAGFFGPSLNVSLSPPIARETPRGAAKRERRRAPREVSARPERPRQTETASRAEISRRGTQLIADGEEDPLRLGLTDDDRRTN